MTIENFFNSDAFAFNLRDIEGFPYVEWSELLTKYEESERWVRGDQLEEQSTVAGKKIESYPLKINPLYNTIQKHAGALFGDWNSSTYMTRIVARVTDDAQKARALEVERTLTDLYTVNQFRSKMLEAAIHSQVYGGCIWRLAWTPWDEKEPASISIDIVHPKSFVAEVDGFGYLNLAGAWIVKKITYQEAKGYGYSKGDTDPFYWYVEHITRTEMKHWVNDVPVTINGLPISGPNPFGFVPVIYIPHMRVTGFYGVNAIDHLFGIVTELNARWADLGDAVNDDSHPVYWMSGVQGTPKWVKLSSWLDVIDLPSPISLSGAQQSPTLQASTSTTRSSTAMNQMVTELWDLYMREAQTPPVAYGEDEGSQRSSLTLLTRFYPLVSHAGMERVWWTDALVVLNKYLMKMMLLKVPGLIKDTDLKYIIKIDWPPYLMRDADAKYQELVARAEAGICSLEHLIGLTEEVDDPSAEVDKVIEEKKRLEQAKADAEMSLVKAQTEMMQSRFDNSGKPGEKPESKNKDANNANRSNKSQE